MPFPTTIPRFRNLPLDPKHPPHSAWDVWGRSDELGTLNHLTPERVVEASREIRRGIRVGLNWPLHQMTHPPNFRNVLKHTIHSIGTTMYDDTIEINTQTSSQWDGFRHCGYADGRFYNGLTESEILENQTSKIGIHAWNSRGIVGRGFLIDVPAYSHKHKIDFDPIQRSVVSLDLVRKMMAEAHVVAHPGDIMLLRTGFIKAYQDSSEDQRKKIVNQDPPAYPGVESSLEMLEWIWDSQLAAVCGDCPSFEAWPAKGISLHPVLLAGFGMPIGELFDLEGLSRQCAKQNRWTFFFTSEPLNLEGGVASPPNAIAIF